MDFPVSMLPMTKSPSTTEGDFTPKKLLQEGHVAVTPGRAFGPCGEGSFRMSYAASEDDITEGIARMRKVLNSL